MDETTLYAFLDELEKIAQVETEIAAEKQRLAKPESGGGTVTPPKQMTERTSPRMDVPPAQLPNQAEYQAVMARRNMTSPAPPTPVMAPPKPPIGERVKSLARRGAPIIKNIEKMVSTPMAPHRYAGVSYRKDFSGFKYS